MVKFYSPCKRKKFPFLPCYLVSSTAENWVKKLFILLHKLHFGIFTFSGFNYSQASYSYTCVVHFILKKFIFHSQFWLNFPFRCLHFVTYYTELHKKFVTWFYIFTASRFLLSRFLFISAFYISLHCVPSALHTKSNTITTKNYLLKNATSPA